MFRTYRHAELPLHNLFGSEFQIWHFIELGIHRPWFYAGTRDGHGDDALVTMKMIPNLEVLQSLLDEHTDDQIESLQVVTPSHVNDTKGWLMETLVSLSVLCDRIGRSCGYRCTVEGGRTYDVVDLSYCESELNVKSVMFLRT